MMTTKIPKQLRLTFKSQDSWEWARDENGEFEDPSRKIVTQVNPLLGFANVYEPHVKTYEKRANTQNTWAYGIWFERDGKMWCKSDRWERDSSGNHKHVWTEKLVEDRLQPIIIDNEPLEGFRIQRSVTRYSTSNKVWRILDPRGFELEISTANMEDIIMGGSIVEGEIMGTYVWAGPKTLVLAK